MKSKYIEVSNIPDFKKFEFFTYEQIKGPKKQNPFNPYLKKEERKEAWKSNPYKDFSGIYFLMNGNELVYIGKTTNLSGAIKRQKGDTLNEKNFDSLYFLEIEDGWEMDVLTRIYINMYQPKYNK